MKLLNFVRFLKRCDLSRQLNIIIARKSRTLAGDRIQNLGEHTLISRIMTHLKIETSNNPKDTTQQLTIELLNKLKNNNNLHKHPPLSMQQLVGLLSIVNDNNYVKHKEEFHRLINILDTECCVRVKDLNSENILQLLDVYMKVVPNRIIEYKFYDSATEQLMKFLDFLTREELVKLMFYLGLQKKTKKAQTALRKCLNKLDKNDLENITPEDLCVICNATFKTSTKITKKHVLEKVVNVMNDDVQLLNDAGLFITFVKTIRHNRFQNEDILNTISCVVLFNRTSQYYSFTAICHILALYADYLYYDENIVNLFVNIGVEKIESTPIRSPDPYFPDKIRIKDIKRFLWALSNLGFDLNVDVIKAVIVPNILERIKAEEYSKDSDILVDTLLYLWILNYQAVELLKCVLTQENVQYIRGLPSKSKAKLNLLLTVMQFENRELYRSLNIKPVGAYIFDEANQIRNRPSLKRVHNNLQIIAEKSDINKFTLSCEVPYLNIVGITGFKKKIYKTVHFEVLDRYVCVKNKENAPTGPMQMKLRILDRLDQTLITINEEDIEGMTDNELQDFLKSEMLLVY